MGGWTSKLPDMAPMRMAVLGAGSVRCSPRVIAALANYFGERPMEICLFDVDEERLELFSRYARVCFTVTRSQNLVFECADLDEAIEEVDLVIVQVGENCARKYLASRPHLLGDLAIEQLDSAQAVASAAEDMVPARLIEQGRVLSLIKPGAPSVLHTCASLAEWPPPLADEERYKVPHQVLRWVRGEEFVTDWLAEHERTPLRGWLDEAIAAIALR